ncbi:MAG: sugar nucleotide-binding protein [Bacteroidales bacterium]|nr:sugar nucleotide-binding protein [Bacteroidales bacterium]
MKRILITGASGFVGGRVAKHLACKYEIIAPSHKELEITDEEACNSFIREVKPDVILHLAAISDTGYCENHKEESYLVNVKGVENLAAAAAGYNSKMVFFSSDQIYNGNLESGLLTEEVPVMPENHYGRHKLLAEQCALEICSNCVALRATWMYDMPKPGMYTHNNFVTNIGNAINNGTPLRFATREFRGITWVEEVVGNIIHTFDLPGGVYNFGAENTLNTYETACEYIRMLGHNPENLILADTERFPEHIRNISISTKKIQEASHGKIKFSDTVNGLALFAKREKPTTPRG